MLGEEIDRFLKGIPPFDLLPKEAVEAIAEDGSLSYYPRGVHILMQGGAPSEHLYLIKKGAVKVYMLSTGEQEMIVDFRSEGEYFGLLSLLGGDRSRTSVMAVEDTIAYLIPKEKLMAVLAANPAVNEYLLKSFLLNFMQKTYDETRKRYTGLSEGDRILFVTPVGDIIRREPVTVSRETTIQEAARVMARHKISSLVITDEAGAPAGIVTDRDLREKVVAAGLGPERPSAGIMSAPLVTVDAQERCFEALLKMMRHNIHHLLVLDGGRPRGVVTNHDFMILQGSSPMVLVREVGDVQDLDHIIDTPPRMHRTVASLLRQGAKSYNLTGIITELTEKVLNRVVDLAEGRHGPAPIPYALFLFGEGGRRALTLRRSLQMGVVYQETGERGRLAAAEGYFQRLRDDVARVFPRGCECIREEHVRSVSEWKGLFGRWADGTAEETLRPEMMDMRAVRGGVDIVDEVRAYLMRVAGAGGPLLDRCIGAALHNRPPLGFFRTFVVEKSGEHRHELNLFERGIRPIVDAVRIFAAGRNVLKRSTRRRAGDLSRGGGFPEADDIIQAVEYLYTLLIHHQVKQVEDGREADDFIDPESLSTLEKKTLKGAFQLAARLHDRLEKMRRPGRVRT